MKRIHSCLRAGLAVLLCTMLAGLTGCNVDDLIGNGDVVEGEPVTVSLNLAAIPSTDVKVTRASGSDLVSDLTIFIYDGDGNYQQTVSTTDNTLTLGTATDGSNGSTIYSVTFNTTSGKKKLLAIANKTDTWWDAENIDASSTNFQEMKEKLLALQYTPLNGEISTPVQMGSESQTIKSGSNEGIVFPPTGSITEWGELNGTDNVAVELKRAFARITFNIPASETTNSEGHTITFVPTNYKVYNVPVKSCLANNKQSETSLEDDDIKNVASSNVYKDNDGTKYSFSFYMPENVQEKKLTLNDYDDREAWTGESGSSAAEKTWSNAPQKSTFVVISGSYTEKDQSNNTVYSGNTQYTVHLGDFSNEGSLGDFSVDRNYSYTYNMTVEGVNKIIVEAEKQGGSDSYQNGAEGQIYKYSGSTYAYNLDAHYEQVYLEYDLSSIADAAHSAIQAAQSAGNSLTVDDAIANNLILVIQSEAMDYTDETEYYTTRNNRGILKPYKVYCDSVAGKSDAKKSAVLNGAGTGLKPTKGFDYKWVELYPQTTSQLTNEKYPGVPAWSRENLRGMKNENVYGGAASPTNPLIDVYDAVVAMGKTVKQIYENKYESKSNNITTGSKNSDGIIISQVGSNYKARFTAYVNEYYYYKHPLTHEMLTSWSTFVNKIPREMIIAMSSDISDDGNSSVSQVYSYISQLSMQTPYSDRNGNSMAAFGMETYNETPLTWSNGFSNRNISANMDDSNGRGNQWKWLNNSLRWSTYISNQYNGHTRSISTSLNDHKLSNAYARQYYDDACMSRNRDLNGDGNIDKNEVRWYLASINEYLRMGLASQALSDASKLYSGTKGEMTYNGYPNSYKKDGALYYTSSKNDERVYWAVEKGAWGDDATNHIGSDKSLPIRCVRVLPAAEGSTDLTSLDDEVVPESFYKSHQVNGHYVLEFKNRMVSDMYRSRTDVPLDKHNEDEPENKFSDGIIVANKDHTISNSDKLSIVEINGITYKAQSGWTTPTKQDPCENYHEAVNKQDKWRVPNLNELVMMKRAMGADLSEDTPSCTQFSNSAVRLGFKADSNINCSVAGWHSTMFGNSYYWTPNTYTHFRCVRDVPSDYSFPSN